LRACRELSFYELRRDKPSDRSWSEELNRKGVQFFYADEGVLADSSLAELFATPGNLGWKLIGLQDTPTDRWRLLQRLE